MKQYFFNYLSYLMFLQQAWIGRNYSTRGSGISKAKSSCLIKIQACVDVYACDHTPALSRPVTK